MITAYRSTSKWLAVLPVVVMLMFVVAPTLNIFKISLDFKSFAIITAPTTRNLVWFTTWQATISTILVLLFAMPIAAMTANFDFFGRRALISLISVPFILPTVVVGVAFLEFLPTTIHRSALAIIIAHTYFNFGLVVRIISTRWQQINRHLDDVASTLGASRTRVFLTVTLPLLKRSLQSSGLLVFLMCFTSYGVVRILGGPARSTIETEIYFRAMQLGDVSGALVLSILQLIVVGFLILLTKQFGTSKSVELSQMVYSRIRKPQTSHEKFLIALVAFTSALVVTMPLIGVMRRSIMVGQDVNFSIWQSIFTEAEILKSLTTSVKYAAFTIVVSTTIGLFGACAIIYGSTRYKFLNLLTALPVVVSAVTLGLGIIVTFDVNPFDWRGAWLMMPIVHCLVAIPIVMRIISPTIRDLPNGLRDASQTLGATTWQMWRSIDLQIIKPALVTAAAIACAVSLGEFGASSFLVRRNNETLPLIISRLLGRPGEIIQAQAYAIATLLIVACVAIIGLVDHLGTEKRAI